MSNTYQFVWNFNSGGQFASNIFHWNFDDSGFGTSRAAAEALLTAWATRDLVHYRNMLPGAVTFLSIKARLVGHAGGFEAVEVSAPGVTGNRAGNMQASGIAPVLIHYPFLNGKLRGRTFLPGLSDLDCDGGYYTAAYRAAIVTATANMFDDLTLVGGGAPVASFGLYSRDSGDFTPCGIPKLSDMVGQVRRRQVPA